MAAGEPLDPQAVDVVLSAKTVNHPGPIELFTEHMVWQLVWVDIFTWCSHRNVDVPISITDALWALLTYLESAGRLHCDSDPIDALRQPLITSGGLDTAGRGRARRA